jgi:hypothetical protein
MLRDSHLLIFDVDERGSNDDLGLQFPAVDAFRSLEQAQNVWLPRAATSGAITGGLGAANGPESHAVETKEWDAFLAHASEDKRNVADDRRMHPEDVRR